MCCVNRGMSSLFGNIGHKLGDEILSQGLILVPTLCHLGELCQRSLKRGPLNQGEVYSASISVMRWNPSTN